jgi:hypothetical protein
MSDDKSVRRSDIVGVSLSATHILGTCNEACRAISRTLP